MKAIMFDDFGSANVLRLGEAPMPEVRPDDLLVKVMAAGVNRADLLQREGVYGSQSYGDSTILGLEVAGEVIATGDGVAAAIPAGMSFTDAAAIMESFVTAWEALSNLGRVAKGETVLVHAAAGGIGSAAVQLAKAAGATVLTTASASNIDNVLIIDFVGGSYLARNIRSLAPGGRLVQVGLLGRDDNAIIPLGVVLHNHLQLIGTVMKSRSRTEKRAMIRRFREQVLPRVGHELKPVIGATYPLTAVSDAHRRMEAGALFGKVVLAGFHE